MVHAASFLQHTLLHTAQFLLHSVLVSIISSTANNSFYLKKPSFTISFSKSRMLLWMCVRLPSLPSLLYKWIYLRVLHHGLINLLQLTSSFCSTSAACPGKLSSHFLLLLFPMMLSRGSEMPSVV